MKLVDMLDSDSNEATHAGSSPVDRTIYSKKLLKLKFEKYNFLNNNYIEYILS